MADETIANVPVDAQEVSSTNAPSDVTSSSLRPAQPTIATATEPTETTQPDAEISTITKEDEEIAGEQATTEVTAPDGDTTEVLDGPSAVENATDATPGTGRKEKRKSVSGVPEHKIKKLNKKKSMPTLNLDCKPGEFYWARLKGYPPWPAIICDEQMLPESLLASRPVSTSRPDGSLRDDFKAGGKNARERTFPIMFLSTNEFSWMINTALTPLDPKECLEKPKAKMTKALQDAYKLGSEDHPMEYYKKLLNLWQEEEQKFAKEAAEHEAEAARVAEEKKAQDAENVAKVETEEATDKKKKKAPRKSKGGDDDLEMEDAEAPKSSKKRKKAADSDAENVQAKKTPKVTKLNGPKTPNGESTKKSTTKPKKKVTAPKPDEAEEEAKPQMTESEKLNQREKAVLYLRHRLQKGFLSRDAKPQEGEMSAMADFFSQLENYDTLEPFIIRTTKIHKVLKAIVKLATIPKEEEYNFKKRSAAMLEIWNKRMEADGEGAPASAVEAKDEEKDEVVPATNGDAKAEPATKGGAEDAVEEKGAEKVADEAAEKIEEKAIEKADDDAKMQDLSEAPEVPAEKGVPSSEAKDEAAVADVTDVADVSMQSAAEDVAVEVA
ncbi:hypothetical protein LTR33_003292 [Friedmanniomyces endolithicus]|nr:hypothetical protein LTR94_010010 [Friedmanniomyces endolithicus]KAK0777229.1 hypothetical protein LTR75_016002 [Friedmanniomyces endolithicus]KAK0794120.1 hypothetical protein LTR38_009316 [Friedmanniomyces endolithicus]KAK0808988.1 hypothetical protein LTR59_002692 [Friedmanniomyces endolithicus]KAK0850234.1 hypothetical protein LTR03_004696 [Friedmanniomyces endolithicus]